MTDRLMITGTEGNEDYLVCARKDGYVLGIKALYVPGEDNGQFALRLRLVKAKGTEDISNTSADVEGMSKVFAGIPWQKRNDVRFSTVLLKPVSWGIMYPEKFFEAIGAELPGLLDSIDERFEDDEHFMDREDCEAYLLERFEEMTVEGAKTWAEYKAGEEKATNEGGGDLLQFPGSDDE